MIRLNTLGVYVHVPFCRRKCRYCDFASFAGLEGLIPRYFAALQRDIEAGVPEASEWTIDSVFFGGGTPTLAGASHLTETLGCIQRRFHMSSDAEVTTEANPGTFDRDMMRQLHESGFNRLSIGLQSTHDRLLESIGRIHSYDQFLGAFDAARRAGFSNIGIDLIYGLPGQTVDAWHKTLRETALLEPEHISAYGLQVEAGTPLAADVASGRTALPSDDETADMFLLAHEYLSGNGYDHYEISNYARPGRACRHNLRYWRCEPYLGFGSAAHSFFEGRRFARVKDPSTYVLRVMEGLSSLESSETIDVRQAVFEYLMLGLRTRDGVGAGDFERRFGFPLEGVLNGRDEIERAALIETEGDRLRLSTAGWSVSNAVMTRLLPDP